MIFKKIKRQQTARPSAAALRARTGALLQYVVNASPELLAELGLSDDRSHQLTRYIVDEIAGSGGEKVFATGQRHLLGANLVSWQAQMAATMACGKKTRDPLEHYVLSWQPDEEPTPRQAEEAVAMLLAELGFDECQAVWALHGNTDNVHVHVAVSRVHPVTHQVLYPEKSLDVLIGHQAITLIEARQGWRPQKRALYALDERGDLIRKKDGAVVRFADGSRPEKWWQAEPGKLDLRHPLNDLSDGARRKEQETGVASAERTAIRTAAPVMESATCWLELHQELAERGIRFRRKGSGAVLQIGDVEISASKAGRKCSLRALEKRFEAAFEPAPADLKGRKPTPSLRHEKGARYPEYLSVRQTYHELIRDIAPTMSGQPSEASGTPSGRTTSRRGRRPAAPFPSFDDWLSGAPVPGIEELMVVVTAREPALPSAAPAVHDLGEFVGRVGVSGWIEYGRQDVGRAEPPAFVDTGRLVIVHVAGDDQALLAALQLSAAKWPDGISVYGGAAFVRKTIILAAKHGIRLADPALRKAVEQIRAELDGERASGGPQAAGRSLAAEGTPSARGDNDSGLGLAADDLQTGRGQDRDQLASSRASAPQGHVDQRARADHEPVRANVSPPTQPDLHARTGMDDTAAQDDAARNVGSAPASALKHPLITEWLRSREGAPKDFKAQRELAFRICQDRTARELVRAARDNGGADQTLARIILSQSSAYAASRQLSGGQEIG